VPGSGWDGFATTLKRLMLGIVLVRDVLTCMQCISRLTQLTHLELNFTDDADSAGNHLSTCAEWLAPLTALEDLAIIHHPDTRKTACAADLPDWPNMKRLVLPDWEIVDVCEWVDIARRMPQLERLADTASRIELNIETLRHDTEQLVQLVQSRPKMTANVHKIVVNCISDLPALYLDREVAAAVRALPAELPRMNFVLTHHSRSLARVAAPLTSAIARLACAGVAHECPDDSDDSDASD
jgi:hypothetical protein